VPDRKSKFKRVTLADIAQRAGVSVATASVAITGRPSGNCRVSPAVAEKIRAVARELHYRPNLQARSLSTQRTQTVAMLIKRAAWHNAMDYVGAAQKVLRSHGYSESFMLHDNNAAKERAHLELALQRNVEGILALPLIDPDGNANVDLYNRLHTEENIPIVQLGLVLPNCVAPSVTADLESGVARTVTLLRAMGHRRIALVTRPDYGVEPAFNPNQFVRRVYLGYRSGIEQAGLQEQVLTFARPKLDASEQFDSCIPLGVQVAEMSDRPTALIAITLFASGGLITGLTSKGLRVPDDVSIVSCGEQPFARMMRPAVATIVEPIEKMGTAGSEMLLKMIEGKTVESVSMMPGIELRQSVKELTPA
jgi:DNA-binding LacI/PurR family transcriptional regulator